MTITGPTAALSGDDPFLALRPADVARDGVPSALEHPLRDWLKVQLSDIQGYSREEFSRDVCLELELTHSPQAHRAYRRTVVEFCPRERLLQAVNAALKVGALRRRRLDSGDLGRILERAGSAYRMADDGSQVIRRIDPTAEAQMRAAVQAADPTAAEILQRAWAACYGVNPDYDKAYGEAIKSVETTLCPLVSPGNPQPTLSKTITTMRKDLHDFTFALRDPKPTTQNPKPATSLETVVEFIRLLMRGHVDRHPGDPDYRAQTRHEAEAALQIAVTITQFVLSGALRRK